MFRVRYESRCINLPLTVQNVSTTILIKVAAVLL
jgi:hypothetical protein